LNPKKQTVKALKVKAWKMFSEYIRRKYSDSEGYASCFTCGKVKHWTEMDAGHGISGRGNFVLFLEEVVRPQCKYCNGPLGGNYEHFVPKLMDLYPDYYDWVAESRKPHKRTKGDYLELVGELQGYLDDMGEA
jgi:hypothetical protein